MSRRLRVTFLTDRATKRTKKLSSARKLPLLGSELGPWSSQSRQKNYLSKVGLQKHQVDLGFFGNNNSDPGSPTDSEERSKSLVESVSIPALFPANKSDTDGSSQSEERPPIFSYCSNSIASFFSPARSGVSENPSIWANEPTSPSISLLFPPPMSNTETSDSCSEFDEAVEARFPYSIVSFFPPAKSQTDSVSENDDINPIDPSIPALTRPTRRTIQTTGFRGRERKHGSNRGVNDSANNSTHGREAKSVKFNIEEILKATWNFSRSFEIGQGGFGKVFRGRLKDGTLVAVKRAKKDVFDKHLDVEFHSEIQTLAKVEHLNLVKFYGYLEHGDERIVVSEYVPNGNLRQHLDCIRGNILSLVVRLDIAIDVAHAITYLHMYTDHPIIHRDIKSSNILLMENFRAKIADFGFARLAADYDSGVTHVSTQVKGTAGYLDPEYLRTYQLTEKSDVYSFGVLLVELVTGRRPIEPKRELKERITAKWAMKKFTDGEAISTLDPKLARDAANHLAIEMILELALQCLAPHRQNRPSMRRCAEILWRIRKVYREVLV